MAKKLQNFTFLFVFIVGFLGISSASQHGPLRVKAAKDYYGKLVGPFETRAYQVSGKVFAVDEDTLLVKDFTYNGIGTDDAYFYIGDTSEPFSTAFVLSYPNDTDKKSVLRNFTNEDVILSLPSTHKVTNIAWLSVWSPTLKKSFGDIKFPPSLQVPAKRVLPEFKRLAHNLKSGNITILDAQTFFIPKLFYDGTGPDAFFMVGNGTLPHPGGRKVPNEDRSLKVLSGYNGKDVTIQLPDDLTVFDIEWLAVFCITYKHNFGHVFIPQRSELNVPPSFKEPIAPVDNSVAVRTPSSFIMQYLLMILLILCIY